MEFHDHRLEPNSLVQWMVQRNVNDVLYRYRAIDLI